MDDSVSCSKEKVDEKSSQKYFQDAIQDLKVKHLDSGEYFTCAQLLDNRIQCWGQVKFVEAKKNIPVEIRANPSYIK